MSGIVVYDLGIEGAHLNQTALSGINGRVIQYRRFDYARCDAV